MDEHDTFLDHSALYLRVGRDGEGNGYIHAYHMPFQEGYFFVPGEPMFLYEQYLEPDMYEILRRIEPVVQPHPDTGLEVKVEAGLVPGRVLKDPSKEFELSGLVSSFLDRDVGFKRKDGTIMYSVRERWHENGEFLHPYWEPQMMGISDATAVSYPDLMKCLEENAHLWDPREFFGKIAVWCERCGWSQIDWNNIHNK